MSENTVFLSEKELEDLVTWIHEGGPNTIKDLLGYMSAIEVRAYMSDNDLNDGNVKYLDFPNLLD